MQDKTLILKTEIYSIHRIKYGNLLFNNWQVFAVAYLQYIFTVFDVFF